MKIWLPPYFIVLSSSFIQTFPIPNKPQAVNILQ